MKIINYLKNVSKKSKIIYLSIGLVVYGIFGWTFGFTKFAMVFISNHDVFTDYIDEIKAVYINEEQDIFLCVTGNTLGKSNIDFWLKIPHSNYIADPVYEKKFSHIMYNNDNFGTSSISHDEIVISACADFPEKELIKYDITLKHVEGKGHDKAQKSADVVIEKATSNHFVLMKYSRDILSSDSKVIYVWFSESGEKFTMWFWTESIGHPELVSPFWKLLYFPAVILDILLWPIWLLIYLSLIMP